MYLTVADTSERAIDLVNMNTSQIIVNNQKRLLQEAVDRLFRKISKVLLCQMNISHVGNEDSVATTSEYSQNENQKVLLSLLGSSKERDVYAWIQFVSMLFCLEISSDIMDSSACYDFLWDHNAFEDKDVWDHLVEK